MSATRVILGQYPTVDALYGAARAMQAAGHSALDFYSPYPLPGSDEVLRLKRSPGALHRRRGGLRRAWSRRCSCSGG